MKPGPNNLLALARKKLVPLEHTEQAWLFQWAEHAAGRYHDLHWLAAVPNFSGRLGKLTARHGARLNAEGRKKGYPDVLLDVARGGYHGLRIELKRQDATPSDVSDEQRAWHKRLRSQGYRVEVCKGWEAARDVLLDYLSS